MPSLKLAEARDRAALLEVTGYEVRLDLRAETTFTSRTVIEVTSTGGSTFLDLKPVTLTSLSLDGAELPTAALDDGRYPLELPAGAHRIVVEAVMGFRHDGEGLHRAVDPADGRAYVYQMSFMSAAPSVFACFDQPDLKAPYTLHVDAPEDWLVIANAAGARAASGTWEFEQSRPLSTYFVALVAGPYHRISRTHDGIDLGLLCRASMAAALDADAEELFTLTGQCFDEFHRRFGIRYAFGKYDQAFVPEFNAGAMENPGCVTFREGLLFTTQVPRSLRVQRATTVAHEMAHQWFGNLVTPQWWDDLWLNEAFAEYMGNRVAAEVTEFSEALVWARIARRNWGLNADSGPSTHPVAGNGATDADAALQDFDGISYSKGHAVLTQLATRVGDDVFFAGVRDHFERHRFGNATMADLFASWERAGAEELEDWSASWLHTAGLDRLALDRDAGTIVRTAPPGSPARTHTVSLATWSGSGWDRTSAEIQDDVTPVAVADGAAVILDPDGTSWADITIDPVTAQALPDLLATALPEEFRASVWTAARNGIHQARLDPDDAVRIVAAGIPGETLDAAVDALGVWAGDDGEGGRASVHEKLFAVVRDPEGARSAVHAAFAERARTAPPGSDLQLSAVQAWVSTAGDGEELSAMLEESPWPGLDPDAALRWRVLRRLASLGQADLDDLDRELARHNDAKTQIAHAWSHARLPDAGAKAWAWQRFTGEAAASNYEVEAIGTGFWQSGREDLVGPYVERYFAELPATTAVRAGWGLADGALFFYPITVVEHDTVQRTDALIAQDGLNPSLRRTLVDAGDSLRRRIAVRERYW